ncbi:hypothetical protein [Curtobacterium poinsettiae]|uniref:hypothetical protein n=1 Tax=Curtobacterium poinsettiae TaxID=159612 RepID=UPI00236189E5|nr:hypothetical protein [Curtobacterium flaccumfaciens]MDD1386897.1 hypothetical protein [Curtobacterium flaccumfaciens pv. poinsettiae]
MRSLLHAPRTRRHSIAAATLGALALVGSLLVATPAQALSDTGTGGVFVPASGRVLDTKVGTGGFSTPMEANKFRTIKIAGVAGIPNDGTVGAVSLNATVSGSPDNGILYGRPDANTSRTTMLIYNGNQGEYVSNSAVVAVSAAGTIQVSTETAARLILDVQGYYTANANGTAAGGFVPVAGKRIVDTRSGLGTPNALLAPGKSVDIQVTGANGVPAGASGAVVNLLPINSTSSDGYLTPYATGTTRPDNALHYAPSVNTSIQAQVRLSSSGKMTIYNGSSTINLVVDLQGYFTAAGAAGASFTPGAGRVFDSRATGSSILAQNETRAIPVAGKAGVPVMASGLTAVVLTLTAVHGGSDGRASVWANGAAQPDTTSINFQADEIRTNTVTVALGANGKINLNNVAAPTNYVIDIQGWYSTFEAPTIACPSAYANQAVIATIPAQPISCTVSVGPAAQSDEELAVGIDSGEQLQTLQLSAASATSKTFTVPNAPGEHTLEAARMNNDSTSVATYTFTLGDWRSNDYSADDSIIDPVSLTPTLPVPDGDVPLPSDATVRYSIFSSADTTTPLAVSDWVDDSWKTPTALLQDGSIYYWSAEIRAASDYSGSSAVVTTGRFAIAPSSTVTDDAEALPDDTDETVTNSEIDSTPVCDADGNCSQAQGEGFTGWSAYKKKVIKKSLISSSHRGKILSGVYCHGSKEQGCDVSHKVELSNSTEVAFGMTANGVSGSFGYTSSDTQDTTATCHSSKNRGVQAYNVGKYWQFKVKETRHFINAGRTTDVTDSNTSGWRHAFHYRGVTCVATK